MKKIETMNKKELKALIELRTKELVREGQIIFFASAITFGGIMAFLINFVL